MAGKLCLEALRRAPDGTALAVCASRLTGRHWNGEVSVYADAAAAVAGTAECAGNTVSGTADVQVSGPAEKCLNRHPTGTSLNLLALHWIQWLDSRRLVTGADDGSVSMWYWCGDGALAHVGKFPGHDDIVQAIAVDRLGKQALSASHDKL